VQGNSRVEEKEPNFSRACSHPRSAAQSLARGCGMLAWTEVVKKSITIDRFPALTVQLFSWEAHHLREHEHRDGKSIKKRTMISRLIFCEVR
jgi:hypothetical protein